MILLSACSTNSEEATATDQDKKTSDYQEKLEEIQAYSAMTLIGDESLLPPGTPGEVSVAAIDGPNGIASFPIIVHNGTDKPVSSIEVSGRALAPNKKTVGTGKSVTLSPNVVLPDGYAIGSVEVSTSEREIPSGTILSDIRVQPTDGFDPYDPTASLDIENFEQLSSGDMTGDVKNPHDVAISASIRLAAICLTKSGRMTYLTGPADARDLPPKDSVTWTLPTYALEDLPTCDLILLSSTGSADLSSFRDEN